MIDAGLQASAAPGPASCFGHSMRGRLLDLFSIHGGGGLCCCVSKRDKAVYNQESDV